MIHSATLTAQEVTEIVKHCYSQSYVEAMKRGLPILSFGSRNSPARRDHPHREDEKTQLCNAANFAAVNYFNPWWRNAPNPGATDYIYIDYTFHVGPGGEFVCDFIADLTEELAVIAPEFTTGEVALGEEIRAVCAEADGLLSSHK